MQLLHSRPTDEALQLGFGFVNQLKLKLKESFACEEDSTQGRFQYSSCTAQSATDEPVQLGFGFAK